MTSQGPDGPSGSFSCFCYLFLLSFQREDWALLLPQGFVIAAPARRALKCAWFTVTKTSKSNDKIQEALSPGSAFLTFTLLRFTSAFQSAGTQAPLWLSPSDARQCAAGGGGRTDLRLSSPWYSWNVEPSIGLFKMSRPRLKLKIWNAPILNFKKTKVTGGHRWNMPLCPHRCTTVTCVYCPASSAPLGMEDSGALSSVIYRLLSIMKLLNILHKILLHVYDIYEAWMNFV